MGNLHNGQSVILDEIVTNEGGNYNNKTGVFTCKIPGVYVFFLNIMTHNDKYVEGELVRNGKNFLSTFF